MKSSYIGWLILLLSSAIDARDPFSPPPTASCLREVPSLIGWRLQGIIGRGNDYRGRLLSPSGKVVTIIHAGSFPIYPWQIGEINRLEINLHTVQSCEQQQFTLQLKGMPN